jgi:hypothetical protein
MGAESPKSENCFDILFDFEILVGFPNLARMGTASFSFFPLKKEKIQWTAGKAPEN